ncbi:MAG: PVC-type heme-binding CxxCH protein [Akkermansiaceae bacterium]
MKKILLIPLGILAAAIGFSQSLVQPREEARRVEVLFLGAPTANGPAHDPIERYRVIRKALGTDGINFTYTEDLADLRREVLDRYDAVMLYANWKQNEAMDPAQEKALLGYVEEGGAFLPIHCASACFGGSEAFVKLVGGRFKSHGEGVFRTTITAPEHPIMKGYEGFETWDETYVHDRHGDDRTILQLREQEPWSWIRKQGQGNVFYTAYGHDMRCWEQAGFHELLRRAILWSVGSEVRAKLTDLKLPELETEAMILPGYRERKTITEGQKPIPASESIKLAQVPVGYEISLFASEPDIVNPIHIAWDLRGRAYVMESVDYPNNLQAGNLGHDRIRICEDTNGDGRADKFTLFADKLSIPTSMVFANGGVICANAHEIIFLKDTDGDDKADVRQTLFTGFKTNDTHAGVSNLRYGFDHWIYATIGYAGFDGTVGGENHKFSTGVFRFRPDGSKLEFLQNTTNNTWGLGFTSDFDILGSTANGNPSFYTTFAKSAYDQAGVSQPRTPNEDGNPKFFPSSMDIRQVDQFDRYTSAAGHAFYTSDRFPENYRDRIAFVCEPTGKLVGQFDITRKGAGFVSKQLPNNLYSSADAWSGPVHAETGPDGAVWICDWYNLIIQHNPTPNKNSAGYDAKNGRGNAYESPVRDTSFGRVYRVYPKGSRDDTNPKLDPANPNSLIAGLSHPNLFWSLNAQRLIVESGSAAVVPELKEIVKSGTRAATHAFYALQALGAIDPPTTTTALASKNRGLRRAAIAHAPLDDTSLKAVIGDGVISANDDRELAEIFVALTRHTPSESIGKSLHATLQAASEKILTDRTLADAWQIAARHHASGVLLAAADNVPATTAATAPVNLLPNPDFSQPGLQSWSLKNYVVDRPETVEMSLSSAGRNGGTALMIRASQRADVGAGAVVSVKPNTRYRIGGWVKTENLTNLGGRGALFNVHGLDNATRAISGTKDWTELNTEFTTENQSEILVHCLFGGYGGATGSALFDDVYLHEVTASSGIGGPIEAVANHFGNQADAASRSALAASLSSRSDDFSKQLSARLGAAPAVAKTVVKIHKPDPAVHERGAAVYAKTCIACHGPDGKGVPGAFPPLDASEWSVGDPSRPIRIVLHGLQGPIEVAGQKFNSVMPPHVDLNDQEIADVLTYVRQSWSNDDTPVSAAAVKQARAQHRSRTLPWTAAELK